MRDEPAAAELREEIICLGPWHIGFDIKRRRGGAVLEIVATRTPGLLEPLGRIDAQGCQSPLVDSLRRFL